jgi:hypothetical protein
MSYINAPLKWDQITPPSPCNRVVAFHGGLMAYQNVATSGNPDMVWSYTTDFINWQPVMTVPNVRRNAADYSDIIFGMVNPNNQNKIAFGGRADVLYVFDWITKSWNNTQLSVVGSSVDLTTVAGWDTNGRIYLSHDSGGTARLYSTTDDEGGTLTARGTWPSFGANEEPRTGAQIGDKFVFGGTAGLACYIDDINVSTSILSLSRYFGLSSTGDVDTVLNVSGKLFVSLSDSTFGKSSNGTSYSQITNTGVTPSSVGRYRCYGTNTSDLVLAYPDGQCAYTKNLDDWEVLPSWLSGSATGTTTVRAYSSGGRWSVIWSALNHYVYSTD